MRDKLSAQFRLAIFLNRVLPRGKGAIPRWIGSVFPCGGNSIITRHNARLVVEPSSLDVYSHIVNSGRTWNWHVLAATAAMLEPGSTLFDIGANVGFISLEIASLFRTTQPGKSVTIFAFEPLPQLSTAIRESANLNGFKNVHVRSELVSDVDGECDFFVGRHSIHASLVAREAGSTALNFPTRRIDSLVADGRLPPPTAIKVDVEGAELLCFRGAANTIRSHMPAILFESDGNCRRFHYERRDVIAFLSALAPYRFFTVPHSGDSFTDLDHHETADAAPADILATTATDQKVAAMGRKLQAWSYSKRIVVEPLA